MLSSCWPCFHTCWTGALSDSPVSLWLAVTGDRQCFRSVQPETVKPGVVTVYYFWWLITARFVFHGYSDGWLWQSYHLTKIPQYFNLCEPLKDITFLCGLRKIRKRKMFIWSISWFSTEKLRGFRWEMIDLKIWRIKEQSQRRVY